MVMDKAVRAGESYEIHFTYLPSTIRILRCLPGWSWSKEKKCGIAKATPATAALLSRLKFEIDDPTEGASIETVATSNPEREIVAYDGPINSPFIDGLRPYQIEGVRGIIGMGDRALLADEMGLGKTIQALTWLEHLDGSPTLVITTASTKYNWAAEAKKWTTRITHVISGRSNYELPPADLYVINYHILPEWVLSLQKLRPVAIVLDEAHNIKNRAAQRTKAVMAIAKLTPKLLPMTGTPIMSHPIEIFNLLKLLDRRRFSSQVAFGMEFCNPDVDKWSGTIVYKGVSNPEKLKAILANYVIRRLKSDVLRELPPKQRTQIVMEIDNREAYTKVLRAKLKDYSALGIKNKFQNLMALSSKGKMSSVFSWIDSFIEQKEKLFVGAHHLDIINQLQQRYKKSCRIITGAIPTNKRAEICKQFDDDPKVLLLIGQLDAAGEGINLQKSCSNVAFVEYPWTPGRLGQFEDRVHRFGQTKGVNIWYLLAEDTMEQHVLNLLLEKAEGISSLEESSEESVVGGLRDFLLKNS